MKKKFLGLLSLLLVINACNAEDVPTCDTEKTGINGNISVNGIIDMYISTGDIARFEQFIQELRWLKDDYMHHLKNIEAYLIDKKENLHANQSKNNEEETRLKEESRKNSVMLSPYPYGAVAALMGAYLIPGTSSNTYVGGSNETFSDKDYKKNKEKTKRWNNVKSACRVALWISCFACGSLTVYRYFANRSGGRLPQDVQDAVQKDIKTLNDLNAMLIIVQKMILFAS